MRFDSHHPPSRPDKTFSQTRDHGAMRHTSPSSLSRQRTVVARAGLPLTVAAAMPCAITGTRSRVIRRVTKRVEEQHGPGVVAWPSRSTFYRLIDALATGRHTFGSAVTRRQLANRPEDGPAHSKSERHG